VVSWWDITILLLLLLLLLHDWGELAFCLTDISAVMHDGLVTLNCFELLVALLGSCPAAVWLADWVMLLLDFSCQLWILPWTSKMLCYTSNNCFPGCIVVWVLWDRHTLLLAAVCMMRSGLLGFSMDHAGFLFASCIILEMCWYNRLIWWVSCCHSYYDICQQVPGTVLEWCTNCGVVHFWYCRVH